MDGVSHKNTKRREKKPAKYSENKDGSENNCDSRCVEFDVKFND